MKLHATCLCTTLWRFGATRRLLQSGWCFAAHVLCRSMHHGRRFHCATPVMVSRFLSGLPQAKLRHHDGVASSEQLPSREPDGLFDEKRVAPNFFLHGTGTSPARQPLQLLARRLMLRGTPCKHAQGAFA